MILKKIAESTKVRVEKQKKQLSLDWVKQQALEQADKKTKNFVFEQVLSHSEMAFICEVKKASPSKGVLVSDFDYLSIAEQYEQAGAQAVSVLTEPDYFQGQDHYLSEIAKRISLPILRKDFTIDAYQLYQSRLLGASAVLLICALLDQNRIERYIQICDQLGLSALVEVHNQEEIQLAVSAGARIIGVNNRNLKTFEIDLERAVKLRAFVPSSIIFVAESGIQTTHQVNQLKKHGVDAVLIGESLMKAPDKKRLLTQLRGKTDDKD